MFNQSNHSQRKGEHSFTPGVAEEDTPPDLLIVRHAMSCAELFRSSAKLSEVQIQCVPQNITVARRFERRL